MRALGSLLLALLLFAAPAHAGWYSATFEIDDFRRTSETKIFKHELSERAVGTTLDVTLKVTEGEALVTLIDPTGATRFSKTFGKGKTSIEERFARKDGEWKVRVDFKNASGKYSIKLVDY